MHADDPAVKLRQLVWEPIAKHVQGATTLLISPDGPLHRLPFGALPGANADAFLLEEMPIVLIPVPQLLPELLENPARDGSPSVLIMGDVDYSGAAGRADPALSRGHAVVAPATGNRPNWDRLPSSGTEALAVRDQFAKRFAQGSATSLRQGDATETAFRRHAGQHRYLPARQLFDANHMKQIDLDRAVEDRAVGLVGNADCGGASAHHH
jgi:CHAT domain-containing protein